MGNEKFLRDRDVAERYGICRGSVWRWASQGLLPPPIRLGPQAARWSLRVLEQWEQKRAAESGGAA